MGGPAAGSLRPGPGRARHGARAGGRRDRHTPPVGFRAGAALGGLRRGARLDAASAAARTAPPAARRRVRPYPRGAVSSAALRPRDFRCGAAPGARAARCRSAHHAAERPRPPPRGAGNSLAPLRQTCMQPLSPRVATDTAYELPIPVVPRALRHLPRAAAAQLWAAVHLPGLEAAEKLAQLASVCQRFTPRVSLVPPDGLLLEVQGSLQLFAGVAGLTVALTAECRRGRTCPVIAFAPLTAARAGKALVITSLAQLTGQLAPLPLRALCWPDETLARLARVGVRTIGAVLRLPRAAFARRFGAAQLAMLDALTGRAPQVHASFRPPERFRRRRELDYELTDHGRLLVALAPLFAALGEFLTARQCGVLQLEGRLWHRHGAPTLCILQLAAPCAEAQHLAALFGEHLQRQPLPAAVGAA